MKSVCQIIIMFKRYVDTEWKLTTKEVCGCKIAVKWGFIAQCNA
jgi:hypothetical protein